MPGNKLRTIKYPTWCPGCPDHMILESVERAIKELSREGYKKRDFAMSCGVGCHGKIFDYLNISGTYGLHGRAIPTGIGMKIGNPNLNVLVFAGDGDTYSEGMAHFIHACRFNPDLTLIVFDNQSFSLTTGQATPTSQQGFKTKAEPFGEFNTPLNPVHLALSANASFVARCNARDIEHTKEVIKNAVNHKGFSFVEVIQDCVIFNLDVNHGDKKMYKISDEGYELDRALRLSREFDYNDGNGRIPLGVFYKKHRPSLYEEWPQLKKLKKKGVSWKGLRK